MTYTHTNKPPIKMIPMNNEQEESRTVKGWVEVLPSDLDGLKVYLNEHGVIRDLVGRRGTVIGKKEDLLSGRRWNGNRYVYNRWVYIVEFDEPYERGSGWGTIYGLGLRQDQFTITT